MDNYDGWWTTNGTGTGDKQIMFNGWGNGNEFGNINGEGWGDGLRFGNGDGYESMWQNEFIKGFKYE